MEIINKLQPVRGNIKLQGGFQGEKALCLQKNACKRRFLSKKRDFNEKHPQRHGFAGVFRIDAVFALYMG